MDNAFDYIIILFFIVSALGSLFKKKKEKEKKEQEKKSRQPVDQQQKQRELKARQQELREALRNKSNTKLDPFETGTDIFVDSDGRIKSEVDEYFEKAIKKSEQSIPKPAKQPTVEVGEFIETVKPKIADTSLRSTYMDLEKSKSVEDRMADLRAQGQKYSIDLLMSKEDFSDSAVLRSKLMNKTTLKELIILNEILGKPKALR